MDDFEKLFNIRWRDAAAIRLVITQKIPALVSCDRAYQNARRYSDEHNARLEAELAIKRAISHVLADHIELLQQFTDNVEFRECVSSVVLKLLDTPKAGITIPESK